ncbi:MAG: tRNA 2-thiouridine(34) synthase MnmA [Pseudomonadota bacterium]
MVNPNLNSLDLPGDPKDTRIVVAMSGGVDSSVVAGLLAREGYDVVGMTLQLYDHGEAIHRKGACCAGQDIHDARRVSETLGIPHYVLDYEQKFREQVINPFMDSYIAGETPIPCVACNQTVKFADLLATAKELGADALATGHYIRSKLADPATGRRALYRPLDHARDQSYFLFATTQDQVDYLRFPLGGLPKAETREIARDLGLVVAEKSDSQDICFVPQGRYSDIINKLQPEAAQPGEICHIDGRVLGNHEGIINFTVGQRRGIGVATGEPIYVVHLDAKTARVVVGPKEALDTRSIYLRDVNWLGDGALETIPETGIALFVKVRSTRPPMEAVLYPADAQGRIRVELIGGEAGIAPGQACVFYQDDRDDTRVLGGGFIASTQREASIEASLVSVLSDRVSA